MRAKLTKAQLPDLLAGWYPYASQPALEALTSFVAWMFVVDDVIDSYSEAGNLAGLEVLSTECSDYIYQSLGLAKAGPNPFSTREYTEPSVLAFGEMGQALSASCTKTQRQRIASEAIFTLSCYRQEHSNRAKGVIPTVLEYQAYRMGSSCTLQMSAMIEFANNLCL